MPRPFFFFFFFRGNDRTSQVPGKPVCTCPVPTTPVELRVPSHISGARSVAFPACYSVSFHVSSLSRLNSAACTLAVYASQHGLPQCHARLASRWLAIPSRTGLSPVGFHQEVSAYVIECLCHWLPPPPSFAWRKACLSTEPCPCCGATPVAQTLAVLNPSLDRPCPRSAN